MVARRLTSDRIDMISQLAIAKEKPMRSLALVFLALGTILPALAQHQHHAAPSSSAIQLEEGLGGHHHPVSTKNPDAQRFFDQGMSLLFGFNHEAAVKSFQRAVELDPRLAMAHWGIALALGPNINMDVDPDREKAAHEAV